VCHAPQFEQPDLTVSPLRPPIARWKRAAAHRLKTANAVAGAFVRVCRRSHRGRGGRGTARVTSSRVRNLDDVLASDAQARIAAEQELTPG
jgi:hypothetical protein